MDASIGQLPFLLYSSSTSLGSLALYRNSVQSLMFSIRTLVTTVKMAFQSIFIMGAFFAAMAIEPRLSPRPDKRVKYESSGNGMKIEARCASFSGNYYGDVSIAVFFIAMCRIRTPATRSQHCVT